MNNNLYWSVYKNLERELIDLSNFLHIDDKQLEIYSIKISELLIRTVVEIESISKELYFLNGGSKADDKDLYFDTDCIDLLESKWLLSKKQIQISAPNFYFTLSENIILLPMRKANKRGSSSSGWQKAYQAVKHNRGKNLSKGSLKHFIRSLAALFILNVYYNDYNYDLGTDSSGVNFNNSLGSFIFSVKLHKNPNINAESDYTKNEDYDACIYLLKPTDETRLPIQQVMKTVSEETQKRTKEKIEGEIFKRFSESQITNSDEATSKLKDIAEKVTSELTQKATNENMIQVAKENLQNLKKASDSLKFEAIVNKQQY